MKRRKEDSALLTLNKILYLGWFTSRYIAKFQLDTVKWFQMFFCGEEDSCLFKDALSFIRDAEGAEADVTSVSVFAPV